MAGYIPKWFTHIAVYCGTERLFPALIYDLVREKAIVQKAIE